MFIRTGPFGINVEQIRFWEDNGTVLSIYFWWWEEERCGEGIFLRDDKRTLALAWLTAHSLDLATWERP